MRSMRLDLSVFYDKDLITVLNCGQSVRNDNKCFSLDQFRDRILQDRLIFRIGIGGGLIEDHDRRIL